MIDRVAAGLAYALAAVLLLLAFYQGAREIHRAHTGPNLCYDIVHGNYVSCEGHPSP